jgi:hypothetical protein
VINSIPAHLAEFGIVAPVGRKGVAELLHEVADPSDRYQRGTLERATTAFLLTCWHSMNRRRAWKAIPSWFI